MYHCSGPFYVLKIRSINFHFFREIYTSDLQYIYFVDSKIMNCLSTNLIFLNFFKVEEEVKNMTEEILKQNGHSVDQEDNGNFFLIGCPKETSFKLLFK